MVMKRIIMIIDIKRIVIEIDEILYGESQCATDSINGPLTSMIKISTRSLGSHALLSTASLSWASCPSINVI